MLSFILTRWFSSLICLNIDDVNCIIKFLTNFQNYEYLFKNYRDNNCKNDCNNLDVTKGFLLSDIFKNLNRNNLPGRLQAALFELKNNKDIIVTRSDKGNSVVVMNTTDYVSKLNNLLSDDSTYSQLTKNPLKIWQQNYNKMLKNILVNFPELFKRFSSYLPALPYMYGLPKIHKDSIPLRPIVSSSGSVTYKLSKWLASHLSPILGKISGSHLKNSEDFITKIRDVNMSNKIMVSFDVDSLFTNVPLDETLIYLERYLQNNNLNLPIPSDVFIKLVKLCMETCFFSCNDNFYSQTRGLPMGNCLSPVLSGVFMEFFEKELLPSIVDFDIIWYRYVDDIFAIVPDNINVQMFLQKLNSLAPSINFKIETEKEKCLPFLDTLIIKNENKLNFKVYRKPTHSNMYVHSFSNHSDKIKKGAINSIFLRAYKICNATYLKQEINFIFDTFRKLGYDNNFIQQAHLKARKLFYVGRNNTAAKQFEKTIVLPSICENNYVKKLFPKNVRIVYSNNATTQNFLRNSITKQISNDAGIYSIKCKDCPKYYIGESDNIDRRLMQHKSNIKNCDPRNPIFKHISEENHRVSINDNIRLHNIKHTQTRKLYESLLIQKVPNMNVYQASFQVDNFLCEFLSNKVKSLRRSVSTLNPG
jgi:hypothetical protein